jgi:hypothetical protein
MLSDRLCIDLTTYMSEVVVDAETQTATVKGGATLGKRVHILIDPTVTKRACMLRAHTTSLCSLLTLDSYSCIYTMHVTSCAAGISLSGAVSTSNNCDCTTVELFSAVQVQNDAVYASTVVLLTA